MKTGINFKAVLTKAGGHAAGAVAFTQLNKLKFMQNFTAEKQGVKGLVTAAIGYLAVPMIAKKVGFAGKGSKGEFAESVGEGLGLVGIMIAANAMIKPAPGKTALFPTISGVDGVDGYEESPIEGLGVIYEDVNEEIAGYEESILAGVDDDDF